MFYPPGTYRISEPLEGPEVRVDSQKIISWVGYSDQTTIIARAKIICNFAKVNNINGAMTPQFVNDAAYSADRLN